MVRAGAATVAAAAAILRLLAAVLSDERKVHKFAGAINNIRTRHLITCAPILDALLSASHSLTNHASVSPYTSAIIRHVSHSRRLFFWRLLTAACRTRCRQSRRIDASSQWCGRPASKHCHSAVCRCRTAENGGTIGSHQTRLYALSLSLSLSQTTLVHPAHADVALRFPMLIDPCLLAFLCYVVSVQLV